MSKHRNIFLGDLLMTLFDRRRTVGEAADKRDIGALCRALMSEQGEISGLQLAGAILARYRGLDDNAKTAFFTSLCTAYDIDARLLAQLAERYAKAPNSEAFVALQQVAEPRRQELLRRLNQVPGGTAELVNMRVDLLARIAAHPDFQRIDWDFVHLLRSWFNRGFLVLRQISWDSSAKILERIVAHEAVHAINDWEDLRRRLHPPDRRCFAFFHPTMPDEPLIFVEVALTSAIPEAIDDLLREDRDPLRSAQMTTAAFYSISNCQKGLQGISFGNLLIKQVVDELSRELPQLETFVTLSPLPGFAAWIGSLPDPRLSNRLLAGGGEPAELRALASRYLADEKRIDGLPLDPVARFHLGNGAIIHDVHADADKTENGQAQSLGVMVNYLYDLSQTEKNHEAFVGKRAVAAHKSVRALAKTVAIGKAGDKDDQPAL